MADKELIRISELDVIESFVPNETWIPVSKDLETTPISGRIDVETLLNVIADGWIPVTETWTRTGNYTFTISGDVRTTYRKGAKVRYKDGGAFEYGIIQSSSYSAPNTTVTLVANSDYAMAAATITDTYLSTEEPSGFPARFNYSVAWSADGGGSTSVGNGSLIGTFRTLTNGQYHLRVRLDWGTTTSATGGLWRFTIPIPRDSAAGWIGIAWMYDPSAAITRTGNFLDDSTGKGIVSVDSGSWITPLVPFTWASGDVLVAVATIDW